MKNEPFSLVVSAPSGAGKSTIIDGLIARNGRFAFSVSTTTRRPRGGEVEGKHYYFTDETKFKRMIEGDEFLEWAVVHGNYYGTLKKEVDRLAALGKIPLFDIDVQGAAQLRGRMRNAAFIFIVPPSLEVLKQRLTQRDTESQEQIGIRLRNAINELNRFSLYDFIVVNDRLEDAVADMESIIRAEQCRMARMEHLMNTITGGGQGDITS
jgi:guanylate kinase